MQIYISTAITANQLLDANIYHLLYCKYISTAGCEYISTAGCKYISIAITANIHQLLDANTYQPPSLSPQAMLPSPSWGYNRLTHPLHDRTLISYLRLPPFPLVHILFLKCPFVIFLAEFIFLFEYFQHSADRIFR